MGRDNGRRHRRPSDALGDTAAGRGSNPLPFFLSGRSVAQIRVSVDSTGSVRAALRIVGRSVGK